MEMAEILMAPMSHHIDVAVKKRLDSTMCCAVCFMVVGTAYLFLCVDLCLSFNQCLYNISMSLR